MKGGNIHRQRGGKFSFAVIALVFATVLVWIWEKNPFISSLRPTQDQLFLPSSEFIFDLPKDSPGSINHAQKEDEAVIAKKSRKTGQIGDAGTTNSTSVSSGKEKGIKNRKSSSSKKVCNYGKGRWVADQRRPLYSGLGCKQWLAEMWACRLTKRPNFSYEGYRWEPENCEMPEFEKSSFLKNSQVVFAIKNLRGDFTPRMQDKTIAFIGDSLGRQQFQSLMCMVTGGEERPDVEDVGIKYGLLVAPGAIRPNGWAYWFPSTNTTILYYWSATLCDLEPLNISDPSTGVAMHLDRPPAFMREFLHNFAVIVLNTGHHWNRGKLNVNKWIMYVNGRPNEDRNLAAMGNAKNFAVHSVVRWIDSQLPLHPRLKVFFRTISPRHFAHGEWNTGGSCDNTIPLAKGSTVSQDASSDGVVESAVRGTKVKILDITALSDLRDEAHVSRFGARAGAGGFQDCLHWCLPGIPDTWNELLCAQV